MIPNIEELGCGDSYTEGNEGVVCDWRKFEIYLEEILFIHVLLLVFQI